MNFNINLTARLTYEPEGATLYFQGSTAAQPPVGGIVVSLNLPNANAIIKGTYPIASSNNNPPVRVEVSYGYYDPSSNGLFQPYITDHSGAHPSKITITSISSTNVQGTFSGTLIYSNCGTSTKTVTNGKFNVNIK
jgi:hypothetical protein